MKRRTFLATTAAACAVACSRSAESPYRTLSNDEAATLEAWCECLIPEDASPGARGAKVVRYIDTQLTGKYKRHRNRYAKVLAALDAEARRALGSNFAELGLPERNNLLAAFERGEQRAAFNMVLDHAMQGFYGNPRHGGNADYASWRMLGVPPAQVRGRLQYSIATPAGGPAGEGRS